MQVHITKNVGIAGLRIHWMRSKCGKMHWCRKAIAIMGSFNMPEEEVMRMSPFDPLFNDNYVEGKGSSKEDALAQMAKDEEQFCNSLWM